MLHRQLATILFLAGGLPWAAGAEDLVFRHGGRLVTATVMDVGATADGGLRMRSRNRTAEDGSRTMLTRTVLVRPAPGQDLGMLLAGLAVADGGPGPQGTRRLIAADVRSAVAVSARLADLGVAWAEPELRQRYSLRAEPNDTHWHLQWNIQAGSGINAPGAWPTTTGGGVTVAVVDTGIQSAHPDLGGRVDAANGWAYDGGSSEPVLSWSSSYHGTFCAGVIGANADNALGIAGIAPGVTLVPVRMLATVGVSASKEAEALGWQVQTGGTLTGVGVSSNSWGPDDSGTWNGGLEVPSLLTQDVMADNVRNGRAGKGVVMVWASGNGGDSDTADTADWDGYASNRYALAIGADAHNGQRAYYSEPGVCLFLSAPVGNGNLDSYRTYGTDLVGSYGSSSTGDYAGGIGTSFAAPQVSAVSALCLAARPELTVRDVRRVLAMSARQVDAFATTWPWLTNAAGLPWSPEHGFGQVDAAAAVALAQTIDLVPAAAGDLTASATVGTVIPDGVAFAGTAATTVLGLSPTAGQANRVETVELTCDLTHPSQAELAITLQSPAGTRIVIPRRAHDTAAATGRGWTFSFTGFLGEPAAGTWQVEIRDRLAGNSGTFNAVSLAIQGYRHGSEAESIQAPVNSGGTTDLLGTLTTTVVTPPTTTTSTGSGGGGGGGGGCGAGGGLALAGLLLVRRGRKTRVD